MVTLNDIDEAPAARRHAARVLAVFVGASFVLHVALLVTLPGWMRAEVRVEPLEVTLERVEPPRAAPVAPREPVRAESAAPREAARPLKRSAPKERPAPPRPQRIVRPEPQPLALPKAPSVPEPAFTIVAPARPAPEASPAAESQAPAAPSREVGRAAAPKGEGAPSEKITPPVFNAAYLRNPEPVYPVSARRRGEQGTVLLKVLVTREGAAASVSVEKTSGHGALDQAALDAVRRWRFAPARRGAEPIESSVLVPIVFKLEGVS